MSFQKLVAGAGVDAAGLFSSCLLHYFLTKFANFLNLYFTKKHDNSMEPSLMRPSERNL